MMHGWGLGGGLGGLGGGLGGMGGGGGYPTMRGFDEQYHCYSVAYADKAHLEKGDKILLPPSAFDTLARLQVDYPMLFKLVTAGGERQTHCGVLEFTAEEGCVYIPFWMMQNLLIEEGSLLTVKNVSLPKATFVKLQPQSVDFLEISNPRAVLEHALRNFSCVTLGDIIQIPYNNKNYHFELKDVKPPPAACIIETDCNVDFDAPIGYQEPTSTHNSSTNNNNTPNPSAHTRSSACPSPAMSQSTANTDTMDRDSNNLNTGGTTAASASPAKPPGIRIVDGKIIRPEDEMDENSSTLASASTTSFLAPRTGATGVQKNAAIPEKAPTVDYWAIQAGDGARLDGKAAAALKDASTGQELDVRAIRAQAAAARALAQQQQQANGGSSFTPAAAAPVSKRKSRVGNKFSRLKTHNSVAFLEQGKALDE